MSPSIVAAPLCGISDYPFRQLCREFGITLTYTEMISSVGISRWNEKSLGFTFVKDEHPVVVQLFGNHPTLMAEAARVFEGLGADAIDINLGCSVKKVVKQGAGSALQRDLILTQQVIQSVRAAIQIPLYIKCRLGWSKSEENYIELARVAQNEGVNAICLHPRYASQLFSGHAEWGHFHALRAKCSLPLIGSGDIQSAQQITEHFQTYPVNSVMLGRGLVGNPWILSDYFEKPRLMAASVLRRHADLMLAYYPEKKACTLLRKYVAKYAKRHPHALAIRLAGNQLSAAKDIDSLVEMLHV